MRAVKNQTVETMEENASQSVTSHGGGHRFNPCRSHHSNHEEIAENTSKSDICRGLPFDTLPYREKLKNTQTYKKWCENGVNGKRSKSAG